MFNMNNKKTKRRISVVIIVILVFAMVIPTLAYILREFKALRFRKAELLRNQGG